MKSRIEATGISRAEHSQSIRRASAEHSQSIRRAFAEHSQSIRRAFAEHSQSIRRAFAEHSQNIRRDFEAENLFFGKTQDQKFCFFYSRRKEKMRKQGPGSRRDVLKFLEISLAFIGLFTMPLNSCAPRATFLKAQTDSDFNYDLRKVALGAHILHPERPSLKHS